MPASKKPTVKKTATKKSAPKKIAPKTTTKKSAKPKTKSAVAKTPTETNAQQQIMITEDNVIDFVLSALYQNLHADELDFENDIMKNSGLQLNPQQLEHIRELVMNTGLVQASVGFGRSGKIYLNQTGISILKTYKLYSAYINAMHQNLKSPIVTNPTSEVNTTNKTIRVKAKK